MNLSIGISYLIRATWIEEDREQLKGNLNTDKFANLTFHSQYIKNRNILLIDDILTTGESLFQMTTSYLTQKLEKKNRMY